MSFLESNLGKRVVSALVAGIPILFIVYVGGGLFKLLVLIMAILCAWEWAKMTTKSWTRGYGLITSVVIIASVLLYILTTSFPVAMVPLVIGIIFCYFLNKINEISTKWAVIGFIYISIPIITLYEIRMGSVSSKEFFVLLLTTWGVDIGAYIFGKKLQGPKIAPSISPNKTWAGLLGGIVGATLVLAFSQTHIFYHSIGHTFASYVLVGILTAVVGQVGDFWESGVKRKFNVKDSSNLIPGHGGILDRIDGLMAIALVWSLII